MSQARMPTRPPLRYFGGKWRLAPWVVEHFPPHQVYVEPFGGGASVLLRKPRSHVEIYNDLDASVVNLFRVLRDPALREDLARALSFTPFSRREFQEAREPSAHPVEAARRLVIRSHLGHGADAGSGAGMTGFRSCPRRGRGSHQALDWARLPPALRAVGERFAGVVVEERPAVDVLAQYDSADALHYVDPPYPASTRGKAWRTPYRQDMATEAEHEALAEVLRGLVGAVVLSGYDCPLYARLFGDWWQERTTAWADNRASRVECLWMNRPPRQLRLDSRREDHVHA